MAPAKHKGQRDSLVISFTSTGNKVNLNLERVWHWKKKSRKNPGESDKSSKTQRKTLKASEKSEKTSKAQRKKLKKQKKKNVEKHVPPLPGLFCKIVGFVWMCCFPLGKLIFPIGFSRRLQWFASSSSCRFLIHILDKSMFVSFKNNPARWVTQPMSLILKGGRKNTVKSFWWQIDKNPRVESLR